MIDALLGYLWEMIGLPALWAAVIFGLAFLLIRGRGKPPVR